MNIKPYKKRENSDFFTFSNNNILNNFDINSQGNIQEKLITINSYNIPYTRENKIKELEITLKPNKINRIISPKNNQQPYLKPKFKLKNRNSFFIKNKNSKNKNKAEFMTNDGIKDLNLNLLKIYYDENEKSIKIIRDKDINKNIMKNNTNSNKNTNKKTLNKNNNDFSSSKNTKSKKGNNLKDIKYLYPDTPSQSTTTENKSDTKSRKTQTKNGTTNSKKQSNVKNKIKNIINEKSKMIKENIYYDNLPLFLKKKKQLKKIGRSYKDLYNYNKKLNNNEKKSSLKKNLSNKNQGINKDILIKKINFNNIEKETSNEPEQKKFISHKNNLSLNMTFERENIKNILYKKNNNINNINNNIKKLYISSVKKRNIPDLKKNNINNLNNFDNIRSCKNAQRNTIQFPESYLFNFYRERKKEFFRNKSYVNQNMNLTNNNNSNNISRESSFFEPQSNLSFTLFKNNTHNYMNENNESILNKTKNILKLNETKNLNTYKNRKKFIIINNYESNFNRYPKRVIQQSHKNFREKIINIPNISYFVNSTSMKENESEKISENNLGKNKRPCSLYFNKNILGKEKEKEKCNISLNDYFNYNNAVYKNNNLTINNININQNNCKNEFDINNNINKLSKLNNNLKKFIGMNHNENNSMQNLCNINQKNNDNNNNIFKFNRNKINFFKHTHNTSLNIGHSFLSLNKLNNL